jgi:NAD(P)-dependent dehydrogenase (short-subunit alcohol dehydrogenase family)
MEFKGQVALVTGASRGIGRAIAVRLAKGGAGVCLNYTSRSDEAEAAAAEIRSAGGSAITCRADVADAGQVAAMVREVEAKMGAVTIAVNNAGIMVRGTLDSFEESEMDRMHQVNVNGVIHVTRAVMGGMKARGFGRIVNVASIAGHGTGAPGYGFYGATKASVALLTRRFALELGPAGITVNAVAPGFVLTELTSAGNTPAELEALLERMKTRSMVGRIGMPEDIAHAVAFLAHPDSGFVTGQILTTDGGRTDFIGHP